MKTFAVMGNFRGGTTAVAGLLIKAGVCWSKNMKEHLEDLILQQHFQNDDIEDASRHIEALNTSYEITDTTWGFKYPGAFLHLDEWLDKVSNPHLIFVYRDPVAVGWSEANRMGFDVREMMERTSDYNSKMTELMYLMHELDVPSIAISYELLVTRTRLVIEGLFTWAGMEVDTYELSEFVNKRTEHGQEYTEAKTLL